MRGVAVILLLFAIPCFAIESMAQTPAPKHDPHTLIVKFAPSVDITTADKRFGNKNAFPDKLSFLSRAGAVSMIPLFSVKPITSRQVFLFDSLSLGQYVLLELNDSTLAHSAASALRVDPNIEGVELNTAWEVVGETVVPNDTWYGLFQWNLRKINCEAAWELTTGSEAVTVGVIDAGVDWLGPDLTNRIFVNQPEAGGVVGVDDDGVGLIDDYFGWDFGDDDNNPGPDSLGDKHGSHVSGIIGAETNNNLGIAGVDWNCSLLPIKVANTWSTQYQMLTSDVVNGIAYGALMGCDVVNMSLKATDPSGQQSLIDVLALAKASGVFIVAAMGNGNEASQYLPAVSPYVMAVGATDINDWRWVSGSNDGSDVGLHIDVVAPGHQILSTFPCPGCQTGTYDLLTGTSMAAPHVSGLAALIRAARPTLTVDSVFWYIVLGADDLRGDPLEDTPGWDPFHGYGRINAYNSIRLAMGQCVCKCFGDPKCDGSADILDVVQVVGEAFRNVTPATDFGCPAKRMDLNADGNVDVLDVIQMIAVAFRNLPTSTQFVDPCQ